MQIAVCDADQQAQVLFLNALHEWDPSKRAECFTNGEDLLKAMREPPTYDIVFLDSSLPGESCLDIAREIKRSSPQTGLVFTSDSQELAVDAYSLNALHYLVKPVTAEGLGEGFQRLKNRRSLLRPRLSLNVGRNSMKVYLDEIICIFSVRHAKEILLTENRTVRIWTPFHELEEKLDDSFLMLNRGTIANMAHIRQMSTEYCLMDNGMQLDFSRRRRTEIRETYEAWLRDYFFEE